MVSCWKFGEYIVNYYNEHKELPPYEFKDDELIINGEIKIPKFIFDILQLTKKYKSSYRVNDKHIRIAEEFGFIDSQSRRIIPSECGWLILVITNQLMFRVYSAGKVLILMHKYQNRSLLQTSLRIFTALGYAMPEYGKEYRDFDVRSKIKDMGVKYSEYKYVFDSMKKAKIIRYDTITLEWTPFGYILWHLWNKENQKGGVVEH